MDDKAISAIMKATGNEGKHNWLYSFMIVNSEEDITSHIFLAGYDKNCNQAFSVRVPQNVDGTLAIGKVDVPKYGCEPE